MALPGFKPGKSVDHSTIENVLNVYKCSMGNSPTAIRITSLSEP